MKILFVCTGNTCRSPMAEGILRMMAEKKGLKIKAQSAGVFAMPGSRASENAVRAMERIGVDISNHSANLINREIIESKDLILTMSMGHKENLISNFPHIKDRIFTINEYAFAIDKNVEDPYGLALEYYEKARDEIYRAIEEIIRKL